MRTSNVVVCLGLIGLAFGFAPAASFAGRARRSPVTRRRCRRRALRRSARPVAPPNSGAAGLRSAPIPALYAGRRVPLRHQRRASRRATRALTVAANTPPSTATRVRALEARPHVCRRRRRRAATTSGRSNISAVSPTATPTISPARRMRASSPTPSWRSATTISTASRTRRSRPNPERARRHVPSRGVLLRRSGGAVSARAACIWTAPARRRDAEQAVALAACWRPTRDSARRRRCSAACCSSGEHVRAAGRASGLMWLTVAQRRSPGAAAPTTSGSPTAARARVQAGDRRRARAGADQLPRALGRKRARRAT